MAAKSTKPTLSLVITLAVFAMVFSSVLQSVAASLTLTPIGVGRVIEGTRPIGPIICPACVCCPGLPRLPGYCCQCCAFGGPIEIISVNDLDVQNSAP